MSFVSLFVASEKNRFAIRRSPVIVIATAVMMITTVDGDPRLACAKREKTEKTDKTCGNGRKRDSHGISFLFVRYCLCHLSFVPCESVSVKNENVIEVCFGVAEYDFESVLIRTRDD
ncbi:MAG: hypothetical protein WCL23_04975 [Candidatus Moraniibacteriota bacterium]